jgi:pimeloyl-ACP methyl ester carboxylesterase
VTVVGDAPALTAGLHAVVIRPELVGLAAPVPVVMIHGVGDSADSWAPIAEQIPADRAVVSYDLRGHGASPGPEGPWDIDDFVADHLRLLAALGAPRVDVVGFSLGGLIAQRIAGTHPESVRRLVVVGAVAGRTEQERAAVLERLSMVEREGPAGAARRSVDRWYSADFIAQHPEIREETIERMSRLDRASYTHAYRVLATTDLVDDLARIEAPTLAVTGEHDVGSPPRMSRTIAQGVQSGRWAVVPDANHSVLKEQPDSIAKEVVAHVR